MRIPDRARPVDYLFLGRPTLLVPVWTMLLVGYYRGLAHSGTASTRLILSGRFVTVFLSYSALMAGTYILNQIADRETDRRNEKLFLLSAGVVPVRLAVLEMLALFACGLLPSFVLGLDYFILYAVSLVMGVLYSARPFRAKGRPVLDLVFNSAGYGMVNFLMGWDASGPLEKAAFLHAAPYCFAVGGVFLNTTIPDIEGDRADGAVTTGVLLGEVLTAVLGLFLVALSLLVSLIMRDLVCLFSAAAALPFFAVAVVKRNRKWYLRSFRMGAPTLVVAAAVLFPYYVALLLLTFASMRLYYKRRFDMEYPSVLATR